MGHVQKKWLPLAEFLLEAIGLSEIQTHRYETGTSQPTLDGIKRLAVALGVSADELIFEESERGPDEELRLQFEAICRFEPEDKILVRKVLDSLIISNEAKRWSSAS